MRNIKSLLLAHMRAHTKEREANEKGRRKENRLEVQVGKDNLK
jgi:hypothetical protein